MAGFFGIAGIPLRRLGTFPGAPPPPGQDAGNQLRRWLVMQILEDEERDRLLAAKKATEQAAKVEARAKRAARPARRPPADAAEAPAPNPPPEAVALLRAAKRLRAEVTATAVARDPFRGVSFKALPVLPDIKFVQRLNPVLAEEVKPLILDLIQAVEVRKRRQREEDELVIALAMEFLQ